MLEMMDTDIGFYAAISVIVALCLYQGRMWRS